MYVCMYLCMNRIEGLWWAASAEPAVDPAATWPEAVARWQCQEVNPTLPGHRILLLRWETTTRVTYIQTCDVCVCIYVDYYMSMYVWMYVLIKYYMVCLFIYLFINVCLYVCMWLGSLVWVASPHWPMFAAVWSRSTRSTSPCISRYHHISIYLPTYMYTYIYYIHVYCNVGHIWLEVGERRSGALVVCVTLHRGCPLSANLPRREQRVSVRIVGGGG